EARSGQIVTSTESAHTQTTLPPLAYPAAPLLLFARIARFSRGHLNALLSEGITTWLSRTLLAGQTRGASVLGVCPAKPVPPVTARVAGGHGWDGRGKGVEGSRSGI